MRRKALFMVLSAKAKDEAMIVLDELKIEEPKTKIMAKILENLRAKIADFKKGSILLALSQKDENIIRAARNIPKVMTIQAKDLNPLDVLKYKYLLMPKASIKVIKETFLK